MHLAAHVLAPSTLGYGLADSPVGMLAWILERWMKWSDNGGDIYTVFTRDELLTHATIYWTGNAIASSIRTYANNNRYPWAPSHDRTPIIEAPTGITFVDYENPPGVNSSKERIESFLASDRAAWYNHVNIAAHPTAATSSPGRSRNTGPPTWSGPSSRSSPATSVKHHLFQCTAAPRRQTAAATSRCRRSHPEAARDGIRKMIRLRQVLTKGAVLAFAKQRND